MRDGANGNALRNYGKFWNITAARYTAESVMRDYTNGNALCNQGTFGTSQQYGTLGTLFFQRARVMSDERKCTL